MSNTKPESTKRLCVVYNFAQLYREPIFKLIDKEWECDWYFGKNSTDIKEMDTSLLKHVERVDTKRLIGPIEWQSKIGGLIRKKEYDKFLMLGEPMVASTWWLLIQKKLFYRKKKVYLWTHGWYGREGVAKKWLKRIFFGMADHVFTYGEYAKNEAIKQGFNKGYITPIHNSLNHDYQVKLRKDLTPSRVYKDYFGNDDPTLLFIGRLTTVKRLDLLLKAVALLRGRGKTYNVVIIGSGEKKEELKSLVDDLDLNRNVWFYGQSYDDRVNAQLIYDADLCVAPGNVGLTAMHTMVFGTPVLTHDDFKWQMPEFEAINIGKTGNFFKKDSVNSISDSIEEWLESHRDSRSFVREACFREIDSQWTPEYQISILQHIIDDYGSK